MRMALCQIRTVTDDVEANMASILRCMDTPADVYIFPEMFLTGYFTRIHQKEAVEKAVERLRAIASEKGVCIVTGGPEYDGSSTYNCAYVITDEVRTYRKIHLPNFQPFDEKERFTPGTEPMTFRFGDFVFGLSICYDMFFPDLIKSCTMSGADVNICISASPVTSRKAFEHVLPARPVENTTYLVFVNNTGTYDGMTFFGGSRTLAPAGDTIVQSEEEGVILAEIDHSVLESARRNRPVIDDTVSEITWPA